MVEAEKDKGFVKDREAILTEVELKVNPTNDEQVDKVIWHTDQGDITWKPKVERTSYEGGFKVAKKFPMERGMLPDLLRKMALACNEKGSINIKMAYSFWKTMVDGQEQTYRFITSQKTLDEQWSILDRPAGQKGLEGPQT